MSVEKAEANSIPQGGKADEKNKAEKADNPPVALSAPAAQKNSQKLCVLLPGFGYGPDKPLLYYAAKVAKNKGVPVLTVNYTKLYTAEETPRQSAARSLPGALADAEAQIPAGYDEYVLVAKSFGTLVAAQWAAAHPQSRCTLLQLTPLHWAYETLYRGVPAFAATGTADPLGGEAFRKKLSADPAITTLFVEGGNHSLDTPPDYTVGVDALRQIVETYNRVL